MQRRIPLIAVLGMLLVMTAACTNKKSVNPLANVGSKQPDKVLFDKAMDAMRHNRFDVARLTLQTLINTYPDSEYIARAKLAVGDSWYAEGGTAALAQAEQEYNDFEIFFPNMPEAAEAQLKIANIHYQQMEKPDRDYTNAKRAEDEYRKLILQYPDSKLVPEAKQRLLEVQEVLAEREFEIGRFYYLRESYPASIARLQSLVESIRCTAAPMKRNICWARITKVRWHACGWLPPATYTVCPEVAPPRPSKPLHGEFTKEASEGLRQDPHALSAHGSRR